MMYWSIGIERVLVQDESPAEVVLCCVPSVLGWYEADQEVGGGAG